MQTPSVSVIVAVLDEAANIDHVIDTALGDPRVIEVTIADGGSTDGTRDHVLDRSRTDDRVRLIDNPDRGQSAGLNRAAWASSGDILVRLDGHSTYAPDYITASVDRVDTETAVGGPMVASGTGPWARATAGAMADPLAIGPARFHHATAVEEVDTVYLGAFTRGSFLTTGGYRSFPSGTVEDTDFYARWRADGRRVVVDPSIRSSYHPRDRWTDLARQYFRYGWGKGELVWVNGRLPSPRPLAPAGLTAALVVGTAAALTGRWLPLAAVSASWAAGLATVAARAPSGRLRTAAVAATMHVGYGTGLWFGLLRGRPTVAILGTDDGAPGRDERATTKDGS